MNIDYIANLRLPTTRAHGIQIMKTCEALARRGASVRLIIPNKRNTIGSIDDPFAYYSVERNFDIVRVPSIDLLGKTESFAGFLYALDLVSFLLALLFSSQVRKDSVIYTRDPVLLLPFFYNKKTFIELHGISHNPLFLPLASTASKIVVLTAHLRDDLVGLGIPKEKIDVVPDGIDIQDFSNPETQEKARIRFGIPEGKKVILYIGRLDGWKGVETLYEAALLLPSSFQVYIIGGQTQEVALLSKKYPQVVFLGARPYSELPDNQQIADVLVLPNTGKETVSARHTSPLKLFSYMASGKPIIASDLPSIREVLSKDTAYFVTPDDPKALAYTIQMVVNDEASTFKTTNARSLVKQYTWDNRAKKILSHLSS